MGRRGVRWGWKSAGVLLALALLAVAAVGGGCSRGGSTRAGVRVLRLGHGLDVAHPVHVALMELARLTEEYSEGRLVIRVYPSEQLGPERDMIEQLQLGLVDMAKISASPLESFVPSTAVFSLPYVFRDREHFWSVLDGEIGDELLVAGERWGLRGVCYMDSGSRSFYGHRPIMAPEDLKGLKIRVQQSRTSMDMVTALGGSPTPISFGELYTALQQGVVDGAENNLPSFHLSRHYEVCRHYSLDEHTRTPDVVLIATSTWDELEPQDQEALQRAAREASLFQRELWEEMEAKSLAVVTEAGVAIHRPDGQLFRNQVDAMLKSYEGSEVGDLINRIAAVGGEP